MIICVRGNHGSGKSTVVRKVVNQLQGVPIFGVLGPRMPEAYRCCTPTGLVYVLGPYDRPGTAGFDFITNRGMKNSVEFLDKYAALGSVVFESILVSTRFLAPTVGGWLLANKGRVVNLILDVSLEQCLEAIAFRQTVSSVKARQNKHIVHQQTAFERTNMKLGQLGFRVEYVTRENAEARILSLIGATQEQVGKVS